MKQPLSYLGDYIHFHPKQLDVIKEAMKQFAIDFASSYIERDKSICTTKCEGFPNTDCKCSWAIENIKETKEAIEFYFDETIRQ